MQAPGPVPEPRPHELGLNSISLDAQEGLEHRRECHGGPCGSAFRWYTTQILLCVRAVTWDKARWLPGADEDVGVRQVLHINRFRSERPERWAFRYGDGEQSSWLPQIAFSNGRHKPGKAASRMRGSLVCRRFLDQN